MDNTPIGLGAVPYTPPAITDDSRDFWTGGAAGELRIYRCRDCRTYIHPPVPVCRKCRSLNVGPERVSGRGTLLSYTVNHQQWSDRFDGPYILALVQLEEQPGVNLISNLIDTPLADVQFGMALEVVFHQLDDAWLPLFRASPR